ncbi:hypothetical protein L596_013135 [Steinernema carpocapsae]|uniref:SHSP domain-containing protein n=1 Tax=Steinernema carpocapsae TaxID=34508 RepID=A0A4U5NZR8_STECR|nr:hypothetical protein L596_013135 [Steinernema carpocapsae]
MDAQVSSREGATKRALMNRTVSVDSEANEWMGFDVDFRRMVRIKQTSDGIVAKINLESFYPTFEPKEVYVDICGHDLQINARKENPLAPYKAIHKYHRRYKLPENVDLDTLIFKRNTANTVVKVYAKFHDPDEEREYYTAKRRQAPVTKRSKTSRKEVKPMLEFLAANLLKLANYT